MAIPQAFHLLVKAPEYQIVEIAGLVPDLEILDFDLVPGIHLDQM
jgi:hypothetical protein